MKEADMIRKQDIVVMKAVALCFKPFLKPEEALIYCDLGRTQFAKKCEEFGVYKNSSGYFKKEDLDRILSGEMPNTGMARKMREL
ncbi:MAG TPA: hypothetical protein PKY86_04545 [Niabella sp.]|nr:hypothetical protein [Niabella sp.]HQX74430.1 hypothetical protein [Chitinophagaceae bacterium]HQX21706.1 hypothetical protein [Niabella sp.]HRB36163.1 hypothetical protein [Niabella sp.]HRB60973.1 hypothetical protein [Niabella sp.]